MARFVVDDFFLYQSLKGRVADSVPLDKLTELIDLLEGQYEYISNYLNKNLEVSSDYANEIIEDKLIIEHLCMPSDAVNRDEFLRLMLILNRLNKYEPTDNLNETIFESEGFTASSYIQKRFAGLVTLRDVTSLFWFNPSIHKVCINNEDCRVIFCNSFFAEENDYQSAYELKGVLWPNLYFSPATTSRFANLEVSEAEYKDLLFKQLTYLNEHGHAHFEKYAPSKSFVKVASSYGIEISPESAGTHKNRKAVRERTIKINDVCLYCEWHTKLSHDRGRVHINFNTKPEQLNSPEIGNKIVIGIFAGHLTT